jgi:purine catabolism regulator
LHWLISQPSLRLTVLAGRDSLDRRAAWAHSIELADPTPWLDGGELLLTTGLKLPAAADAHRAYIRKLARAGVSAVGFGVGLSHEQVPPAVVEAAQEAGLPLLEVPLSTPFIAVTRAVMDQLAQHRYEGISWASRVQPRMTRAALHDGVHGVVRELATATDTAVIFLDAAGTVLAAHPAGAARPDTAVLAALPPGGPAAATNVRAGEVVAVQQVAAGPRLHGQLMLTARRPLTPVDHLLLGHAASLVALDAEKPLRLREQQNQLNGLVLHGLLDGAIAAPAAQDYLAQAGFPASDGIRILILRSGDPRPALELAAQELASRGLPLFGAARDEGTAVLLPGSHDATAHVIAGRARTRLRSRTWAGLSTVHSLSATATALREAVNAAAAAQAQGRAGLLSFGSMAGHVLMAAPETRTVLTHLASVRLRPLAACDDEQGTELLASLRAFLEHNGRWETAAAVLGVHRHTLRSRIERVQHLLSTDLDSAHVRAELLLALSAWQPSPGGPDR